MEKEDRFVTIGTSAHFRTIVKVHTDREDVIRIISAREKTMKKESDQDEMLKEYDFSKGVRGKYAKRYHQGSNIVVLAPDVAERFPNSDAVNQALRSLASIQDRKGT